MTIISANSINAASALRSKLSALENARRTAARTRTLSDGRIRYYGPELPANDYLKLDTAHKLLRHSPSGDILHRLFGKIHIPPAVENEVFVKGKHYPNRETLRQAAFIEVLDKPENMILCDVFKTELDDGEAEVITLGLEKNADLLILDEIAARTIAKSRHLPFTGSVGCLTEAKRLGIISSIRPLLDAMRTEARFWINENLYQRVLKDNNEL